MSKVLSAIFSLLLLAGCSVYQPHPQESHDLPAEYGGQSDEPSRVEARRWWESFNDPALNELMDRCFQGNLDLQIALARLEQVEALEKSRNATLWPAVNANGSAGRRRALGLENDSYGLSVGASYELDIWHKLASQRRAASYTSQASALEMQALYLSLSAQLAESYYQVVLLQNLVSLNEEIIDSFSKTVELVRFRYQQGLVSSQDLYQARQNLLRAQVEYPQLIAQLGLARHRLSLLLGEEVGRQEHRTMTQLPDLEHSFATGLPAQLLKNRPDIQAALARLQAADSEIGAAVADRFPAFKLTADYGGQSSDLGTLLQSPNIFWNLLVNISQPIIDGGRRKSEVERRRAVFREQAALFHKTVLTAFAEVEDALVTEKGVDETLVIVEEQERVGKASLRLALEQYQQGVTDFLPVLTAQSSYANARIALIKARQERISSRIQLARALGGQWMSDEYSTQRQQRHDR